MNTTAGAETPNTNEAESLRVALQLIVKFEGFSAKAYTCPAGVRTIGYGFTDKETVSKGTITRDEANAILIAKVKELDKWVDATVKVPLTTNQRGALVSFIWNIGKGAFQKSTLLKELNAGQYDKVPAQLSRWKYANGQVLQGLVNRRVAEAAAWNK